MGYLDNTGLAYLWGKIKAKIPTKTSDLTNDSGFLTSHQDVSGKLDKSGGTMTGKLTLDGAPSNNLHAATKKYVDDSIAGVGGLPSQTGNSGKFLTTNGSSASWATVDMSAKSVFYATYGTTTYAEIVEAYNAGKYILVSRPLNGTTLYAFSDIDASGTYYFRTFSNQSATNYGCYITSNGTWAVNSYAYVPTSRTVNGKALSANITLTASDVGALPSSTTIPSVPSDIGITYGDTDLTAGTSSLATGTFYAYYE